MAGDASTNGMDAPNTAETDSVARYYDSVAADWDATHGAARQNTYFARQIRARLTALLEPKRGAPVALELGAGTGPYVDVAAGMFEQLISCDVSAGMLAVYAQRIQKSGLQNVRLLRQDATDLVEIASQSVDVVFSIGLLETVADYDRIFKEAARVLKPNGMLAGITSNGECPWYSLRKRIEGGERHARRRYATAAVLHEEMQGAGFVETTVDSWGAVPPGIQNRAVIAILRLAETVCAPTPLVRYLGLLSFFGRRAAIFC